MVSAARLSLISPILSRNLRETDSHGQHVTTQQARYPLAGKSIPTCR